MIIIDFNKGFIPCSYLYVETWNYSLHFIIVPLLQDKEITYHL